MAAQDATLAASAARATDGEGVAVNTGRAGLSGSVVLEVTVASGTDETLSVTIETSETGLGDWTEVETFDEITGVTEVSKLLSGLQRYLRATWTIGGTTPSFTFSLDARLYDHLITVEQLEARISAVTLSRVFDDSGQGSADDDAINQILDDVSSMLRGKIGPVADLAGFTPETQSEVRRIGLDVAVAMAAIRHPEVMRKDGIKLMEMARRDLREIRLGHAGIGSTEPALQPDTNDYGVVVSDTAREPLF